MQDMLVKLYELPDARQLTERLATQGIAIRPALAAEKQLVEQWIQREFGAGWASEASVCFSRQPVSCILALEGQQILGFGCYETAYRNFFGPTGVLPQQRGRGIGKALLLHCLHAMKALGYGYAIIGGVGPADFYRKAVGATLIPGSDPGIYRGLLRGEEVD
ncbi:MAG: N-acetyltransferase [Bacteroidetes bacterium]|nr:MAG: N-acetyltransferase [Bacteroidota bacterium]